MNERMFQSPTGTNGCSSMSLFQDALSFLSGAIFPFAFAPFHWAFLVFISLLGFGFSLRKTSFWRGVFRGFLFGLSSFGIGVSWIFISVHRYGNAGVLLALAITALFIAVLAVLCALKGGLIAILFRKDSWLHYLLAFPLIWVFEEWVRGWLLTGFPWLYVGYTQTDTWLNGYAPVMGVFGVSWITLLIAGCLLAAMTYRARRVRFVFDGLIVAILLGGFLLQKVEWTKPLGEPLSVSLVQGNIPQEIKWKPDSLPMILNRYWQMTEKHWDSQLIVWPEAAVPLALPAATPIVQNWSMVVEKKQRTILLGIPLMRNGVFLNAAIAIGRDHGQYLKRHLVPFGEYVPWGRWVRSLMQWLGIRISDLVEESQHQELVKINGHPVGIYICYEIAYPYLVRQDLPDAELLITITDDSWFGQSIASAQQFQMAQMRALELGRYGLVAGNNGITAIVNPKGKIVSSLRPFETGALRGAVEFMKGYTPFIYTKR